MPPKDDEKDLDELEELEDEETPEDTDDNDITEEDDEPTPKDKNWEKSYKGLQKSSAKKIAALKGEVEKLTKSIDSLTEQVEGKETDNKVLVRELVKAKETLEEATANLESANEEKAVLDAKVARRDLVAKKHPALGPLQQFIPEGESIEDFEKNVQEFEESLKNYTDNFVEGKLEGASPPPPEEEETVTDSEEDRLWETIRRTAGSSNPDDVKEYNKANEKWLKIQAAKT